MAQKDSVDKELIMRQIKKLHLRVNILRGSLERHRGHPNYKIVMRNIAQKKTRINRLIAGLVNSPEIELSETEQLYLVKMTIPGSPAAINLARQIESWADRLYDRHWR